MHRALTLLRLGLALVLAAIATDWRSPFLAAIRPGVMTAMIVIPIALIVIELRAWRRHGRRDWISGSLGALSFVAAGAALGLALWSEARFRIDRHALRVEAVRVGELGRHLIVGYRDKAAVAELIRRHAIGGLFVTARNVDGLTAGEVREQIRAFQDLQAAQGLPPLWIAADQEGGAVSRLSPPLPHRPSLAQAIAGAASAEERGRIAHRYGADQGRELADLGITVNLAPVVDLNLPLRRRGDVHTRIDQRAIWDDAAVVTDVAGHYCAGLAESGVRCTLKHFPGLGRVLEDTHIEGATLTAAAADLAASDWVPFRALMRADAVTMLSHVRLAAVDPTRPASFSAPVVSGLLRGSWGYDGVLMTDDFSMGAVYASREGITEAAVVALNAGVDLILVSYDPDLYFPVMAALLRADRDGRFSPEALARSKARLSRSGPLRQD